MTECSGGSVGRKPALGKNPAANEENMPLQPSLAGDFQNPADYIEKDILDLN